MIRLALVWSAPRRSARKTARAILPVGAMTWTPLIPVRAGEFEGPLDLLLELVRRNQITLESMPLAEITRQYLDYLREAQRANVDLGADFIYMAATLIQIKSRLLLPQDPALARRGADTGDTPESLIARLQEHARAKAAAEMLKAKLEVEETVWSRAGSEGELASGAGETWVADRLSSAPRQATLADLIDTLGEALRRVRNHATMAVETDPVTVEDRIEWLHRRIAAKTKPMRMTDLLREQPSQVARCCLFLGILELGRDGHVHIEQSEPFGEVMVARC
jgi:segregation and condensation protein A